MRKLWAWYPPKLIGILEEREEGLTFKYSKPWLKWKERFSLSASLPLNDTTFEKEAATFFANLLPEGGAREAFCRKLGISADNDFELLIRIGRECAGALVLTEDEEPPEDAGSLEEIDTKELAEWLKDDSAGLLDLQVEGDLRLSLAGAQNKLPLVYQKDKFYKPLGYHPTTHILKPAPKRFKNLPENEWIHAQLYRAFGLQCAPSELVKVGSQLVLLVERYDRAKTKSKWVRLHQEDFCQALAVSHKRKYESEGGPSLLDCLEAIEERSSDVATDTDAILKWQILNVLTGNCDGHAKNLSLVRHANGSWRLAPFYDLVDTKFYPNLTHRLAMSVNGHFDSGTIHSKHWKVLFERARVSPASYIKLVKEMAERLPERLDEVLELFKQRYGKSSITEGLKSAHRKSAKRVLSLLK